MHFNPGSQVSLSSVRMAPHPDVSHAGLGSAMTLHIRRLLMSPLPAFEGEMAACGGSVPPAVIAGSKCLAICIEVRRLTVTAGTTLTPGICQ